MSTRENLIKQASDIIPKLFLACFNDYQSYFSNEELNQIIENPHENFERIFCAHKAKTYLISYIGNDPLRSQEILSCADWAMDAHRLYASRVSKFLEMFDMNTLHAIATKKIDLHEITHDIQKDLQNETKCAWDQTRLPQDR